MVIRQLKNKSKKFIKSNSGFIPILVLILITALTALSLRSLPTIADPQKVASSVTVASSCSFTGVEDSAHPHQVEMLNGQHFTGDETGYTTLSTYCNDANGYNIYAQGCTIEDEDGNCVTTGENTRMIDEDNTNAETNYIATGVYPDILLASTPSSWAMTLIPGTSGQVPDIAEDYKDNKYNIIPTTSTLVASYPATTTGKYKTSSTLTTNYEIYINQTQPSGTYVGKVKYTMVTVPAILAQTYIQDLTLDQCKVNVGANGNSANIGGNITVADIRDGNLYTVRYINGQCWMTQNLRFVGNSETSTMALYPNTSNVAKATTLTYYDLADPTNATSDGPCYGNVANGVATGSGYTNTCIYSSKTHEGNDVAWYNFAAASAGTITGTSNTDSVTSDVCPAGWRLPAGPSTTAGTDLSSLMGAVASVPISSSPSSAAFGGIVGGYYKNGVMNGALDGRWWASQIGNADPGLSRGHILYYDWTLPQNDFSLGGGSYLYRSWGVFVRCILDDRTLSDIAYMQEVTPAIVKNTAEGAEATLTDLRTYSNGLSNTYTVKKINDELWMTQNLRITGTISAQYSNFSGADYNVSAYDLTDATNCSGSDASAASPKGYVNACSHAGKDSAGNDTAWYNYAATTAGTITGYENSTDATQDICPSGWHLPTGPSMIEGTDFNTLVGNTTPGWQSATAGLAAFNAVAGGYFINSGLVNGTYGFWWGSGSAMDTPQDATLQGYEETYQSYGINAYGTARYLGQYIRCVANS